MNGRHQDFTTLHCPILDDVIPVRATQPTPRIVDKSAGNRLNNLLNNQFIDLFVGLHAAACEGVLGLTLPSALTSLRHPD